MRVLVVDDSQSMRRVIRDVLCQLGLTAIEEAHDGQDGLSKVMALHPELVIVDRMMPVMDGLTFVREFRKIDLAAPILMIADDADRDQVLEAIDAGVSCYVLKPFTPDVLSQKIVETIRRASKAA